MLTKIFKGQSIVGPPHDARRQQRVALYQFIVDPDALESSDIAFVILSDVSEKLNNYLFSYILIIRAGKIGAQNLTIWWW